MEQVNSTYTGTALSRRSGAPFADVAILQCCRNAATESGRMGARVLIRLDCGMQPNSAADGAASEQSRGSAPYRRKVS